MNKDKNKINFSLVFITFLTSFLLWVIFSLNIAKNLNNELLKEVKSNGIISVLKDENLDLTKFWEVYNIMKINSYDIESVKKEKLIDSTIKWLVDWLWDKHSEYLNKNETEKFNEVLSWDFEWIWAVVEKNEIWVLIERLIKWAPAIKSWLKAWDIIIKANNIELKDLSLYDAVDKIKWPSWTEVILELIRPWELSHLKISVIRERIKIPSVDSKLIKWTNIWYISLNIFWEDTYLEFDKALKKLYDTDWIIIDLRDNWWGYLQSAVFILSELIEDGKTLVVTKYKDLFSNIVYPSINDWNIYKWKIVVLINENSASASEITAWALRDYKKAIIVGKKSYGKWSVQKPFDLKDWSMVKITIAKWFTPNDINIDKEWIIPDIEVWFEKQDYDLEECKKSWVCDKNMPIEEFEFYDRQLEEAKNVLNIFIENNAYKFSIDKYLEENPKYNINISENE